MGCSVLYRAKVIILFKVLIKGTVALLKFRANFATFVKKIHFLQLKVKGDTLKIITKVNYSVYEEASPSSTVRLFDLCHKL